MRSNCPKIALLKEHVSESSERLEIKNFLGLLPKPCSGDLTASSHSHTSQLSLNSLCSTYSRSSKICKWYLCYFRHSMFFVLRLSYVLFLMSLSYILVFFNIDFHYEFSEQNCKMYFIKIVKCISSVLLLKVTSATELFFAMKYPLTCN